MRYRQIKRNLLAATLIGATISLFGCAPEDSTQKEEIKNGEKWFVLSFQILLSLFVLFLFYFGFKIYLFYIGILIGLVLSRFVLLYFLFGLSLIINFNEYLFLNSSFIFVLGIFYGALKKNLRILFSLILFLVPFLLFFLRINLYYLILGFVAGALLRKYDIYNS